MRLTWVSGSEETQLVQYGDGETLTSKAKTFSQDDMCSEFLVLSFWYFIKRLCNDFESSENCMEFIASVLPSPAKDFGWHDPGYIHSAVMTGLRPSTSYSYRYGR